MPNDDETQALRPVPDPRRRRRRPAGRSLADAPDLGSPLADGPSAMAAPFRCDLPRCVAAGPDRERGRPQRARRAGRRRQRPAAARQARGGAHARAGRLVLARSARRGLRALARRRAEPGRAVPHAPRRPRRRGRQRRGGEDDPAARARARLRDPVRVRRQDAAHRHHRAAERPGPRRAPARHAPCDRVRGRAARGRAHRGAAPEPRVRGAERRADGRRRRHRRAPTTRTDDLEADDGISDAPLVRLVNSIIFQAAEDGASDVHFEPQEDALIVRFRVDGVLHVAERIPNQLASGVITRLKVLAKLDIAERRKPQDGRISLNAGAAGRLLDIRVATLPTVEGESVTMRLLDKSQKAPTLEELGLSDAMRDQLRAIIAKPDRRPARHRPDRLRQVDDALRGAGRGEPSGDQRDHRRGPGRVPAPRHQPGSDQPARRPHVRHRAALDPALRPRRRHGRRDPRRRDGEHLDRGRAHRALRALDAAHERRPGRRHAPQRDGRRAVPHRRRRLGRAGPAARCGSSARTAQSRTR